MNKLYRGVSKKLDDKLNRKIIGKNMTIGDFTIGKSEDNTVRLHHIESGLEGGCAISTTTSLEVAKEFATNKYTEDGYVYILNRDILEEYSIQAIELNNPLYPDEAEVSLIVSDCQEISEAVIIEKIEILGGL